MGVEHRGCKELGRQTNNVAEFQGLIQGLLEAQHISNMETLVIKGDSKLVINQLRGRWVCKAEHLKPLVNEAKELVRELKDRGVEVSFQHIPRDLNKEADALANSALGVKKSKNRVRFLTMF